MLDVAVRTSSLKEYKFPAPTASETGQTCGETYPEVSRRAKHAFVRRGRMRAGLRRDVQHARGPHTAHTLEVVSYVLAQRGAANVYNVGQRVAN